MIAEAKNKNDPDKGACKGQQKEKLKCERDDDQKERWDWKNVFWKRWIEMMAGLWCKIYKILFTCS